MAIKNEAVGILEVFGLACAFMAADSGCKAGNVRLENFDRNKPANAENLPVPLLVTIKFRGAISDVEAAMDAAEATAKQHSGVVQRHIIASPTADTAKMLKLSGFDI
ncbi:MAG: BMC domain-containing protein [Defluviitaleaceae bacterium]|nr:BMC domain-containing protein [Defluviitaleaceae bacterium]